MKKIDIIIPEKIGTVAPEIYGHFSEHIGGVFYDGLWVGKKSNIPNINGWRTEAVEALRKINPPRSPLARRMLCRSVQLERRHR